MLESDGWKVTFEQELEDLQQALAELLVEARVNHAALRSQWNRLDDALRSVRAAVSRLDDHSGTASIEVAATARARLDELKLHVSKLRARHWQEPRTSH